ncbi:MAG: BatD family protein [Cellvibrionaceae bacterium]
MNTFINKCNDGNHNRYCKKIFRNAFEVVFLVVCLLTANLAAADLTAKVDRTVISADESIQLTVRLNEQVGYGGPNFELLKQDFDVINQQRSNQFRSINGRTEGWTEWNIAITPKKSGKLLIPSFEYKNAYSDAIAITVNEVNTTETGNERRDLFATTEFDKTDLFVQEQLLVTVKIHTAVDLREIAAANEFTLENAIIEKVSDTTYRKNINQRPYRVNEVVYAVYPQKSGELIIPSLSWLAVVANQRNNWDRSPFFSNGTTRKFRTSERAINVKIKPVNYTGVDWLPAQDITIEQHWSSDPDRFVVGEPITRSITISADGLTSSQLPPLPKQNVDGMKFYSDQPQFDDIKESTGVTGYRIENFAMVPSKPGPITLPEIVVTWWDTLSNQQKTSTLPSQTFTVAAAAYNPNSASISSSSLGDNSSSPNTMGPSFDSAIDSNLGSNNSGSLISGHYLSNKLLLGLIVSNIIIAAFALFFLFSWLRLRDPRQKNVNTLSNQSDEHLIKNLNKLFNQFRHACHDNQAAKARDYLSQWAQLYWQLPQPASLSEIETRCNIQDITKSLEELDKILYGNETSDTWSGKALWNAMVAFKQADKKNYRDFLSRSHKKFRNIDNGKARSKDELTTLYP